MSDDKLTAEIVKPQMNGRNMSGDRALLGCISVIARYREPLSDYEPGMKEVVVIRYWGAKSGHGATNDASIWVRGRQYDDPPTPSCAGYGRASGWGYHRPSAALDSAIQAAGIRLSRPIDGFGDQAMQEAARAIAEAAGYTGPFLVVKHS